MTTARTSTTRSRATSARLGREASLASQRDARLRSRRRRLVTYWAFGGATLIAIVGLVVWVSTPQSTAIGELQDFPIQGRTHIQRGQNHPAYNSVPPTSGWHYADQVATAGVHVDPIPNEVQAHNLEHGEVMVQYDCPTGCPEMVSALERIVRTYPRKVVLAPYPGIGRPIALTSWGRLKYLDRPDEAAIRSFVAAFKDKGPEVFPDEPMATP